MISHGIHQDQYVVVVAEAPSSQLEEKVERIKDIDGVLAIYTTSVTIEDELDDSGGFDDSGNESAEEDES